MPQNTPDKVIDIPGHGQIAFPSSMSDAQIEQAASRLYRQANPTDAPSTQKKSWVSSAADWLPTIGGGVGGIVGGIPGAAIGGAAGEGMRTALTHLGEIPGAVADVSRNLMAHPKETIQGGMAGMREGATNAATAGLVQGASEGIGRGVMAVGVPAVKRVAGAMMQSAVKPGVENTARALAKGVSAEDLPVVKTLLNEGVNVSTGGLEKLRKIIKGTNDEIESILQNTPGQVNPADVATRTESLASDLAKQVDPASDVSAVSGVTERFLGQEGTTKAAQVGTKTQDTGVLDAYGRMVTRETPVMGRVSRPLSLSEAQGIKQGTYRSLNKKAYGEMKGPEIEANKALARGLKEELEVEAKKAGIDLGKMNMREGNAIKTLEAVANRLAANGNTDPIALAWLASNSAAGLGFLATRSPAVKSLIARGLYAPAAKAANLPWLTPTILRTMVQSVASLDDGQESD